MDDRERARRRVEEAMARLEVAFGEAQEAYRRLEEAHRRGEHAPALLAEFLETAYRVHLTGAATHDAHEEYRRAVRPNGEGSESPSDHE